MKHLLGQFIHRIEISTDWTAHPSYLIPKTLIPEPRAARGSGTPVRICEPNVEVAGIEPASDGVKPGLLRAQPVSAFLSPGDHTGKSPSRAQSLFSVPSGPATGPLGSGLLVDASHRAEGIPGLTEFSLAQAARVSSVLLTSAPIVCDEVYEITSPSRPASPGSTSTVETCHPHDSSDPAVGRDVVAALFSCQPHSTDDAGRRFPPAVRRTGQV